MKLTEEGLRKLSFKYVATVILQREGKLMDGWMDGNNYTFGAGIEKYQEDRDIFCTVK